MNMPKISSRFSLFLLLLIISTLTIIPYLGLTNFHTKGEPREAIVAVSMLQNDNWILPVNNGSDIAYKPPFFHWCIAALSLPTGEVTEFTSRLPSALAVIIMSAMCFLFFAKRSRNDIAFLSALLLLSGFEVHRAAMASRVDMVLTCFIVLALLQLYRWWEHHLRGIPVWAILFMSIATLTKGPVGIILPCTVIGVFLLLQKVSLWKTIYKVLPLALLACILPLAWYYAAYLQGGDTFLQLVMEENFGRFLGKMTYESHEQPVIYYFYITLAGWLPWSLLVIMSLFVLKYKRPKGTVRQYWNRFKEYIAHMDRMRLFSLLAIVIIFVFYCIPKSKRSVYILPIYPFIAYFLAEYMLYDYHRLGGSAAAGYSAVGQERDCRPLSRDSARRHGLLHDGTVRIVEYRVDYLGHLYYLPHLRHLQEQALPHLQQPVYLFGRGSLLWHTTHA